MGGDLDVEIGAEFLALDALLEGAPEAVDRRADHLPARRLEHLGVGLRLDQNRRGDGRIDPLPRLLEHRDQIRADRSGLGVLGLGD